MDCEHLGVTHYCEDLSKVFSFNPTVCSLLQDSGRDIAEGSYQQQSVEAGSSPVATYVPYRNGLFLSYAAAVALQLGARLILYGAHRDDAAGDVYPDCSSKFVNAQCEAIYTGTGRQVQVLAPWIAFNKRDIVNYGLTLNMTHEEFEHTWSCYNGADKPCGVCGTCIDRKAAFTQNGIYDID